MLRTARLAACKSMALFERILAGTEAPLMMPGREPYAGIAIFRGGIPGSLLKFSEEPTFNLG